MSKRNAVIRRLTAVETLGCAQVICSDKTGTLTQNKMTVVEHVGEEEPLARAMSLCSDAKPGENGDAEGEPTECALVNYATSVGLPKGTLEAAQPRVGEAPFDSGRKMMSTVHENNGAYIQYTKGAPDVVLSRCTSYAKDGKILPMTEEARAEILRQNKQMADKALRVLCAASREWPQLPPDFEPDTLEQDLTFLGLTGMIDPIRPEVKDAMTGDGVNDAPSIKSADIGIGMGITGTDVTKNVADMVLADDNFATIVNAVEEGRRIYDNIRKAIQFLLGSNMSEVLSVFFATLMGFVILEPVHLLWINLITDCFPALALGLEKGEPDLMHRKPRPSTDGIFSGGLGVDVAYQGFMVTCVTLAAYFIGHWMESGVWEIAASPDGVTMAFLTMSMAEIFHSFNMRSQRGSVFTLGSHNKVLWGAMLLSLVLTTGVIYLPGISDAFGFTHISAPEYAVAMALAVCVIPIVECVKFFQRKAARRRAEKQPA